MKPPYKSSYTVSSFELNKRVRTKHAAKRSLLSNVKSNKESCTLLSHVCFLWMFVMKNQILFYNIY